MTPLKDFDVSIGAHRIRFESPDLLTIVFGGLFAVEEAQKVVQITMETSQSAGPVLLSVDVARFQSSGRKVREIFAKGAAHDVRIQAMGIWGASFPVQMAMMMVIRAGRALKVNGFAFPLEFKATEEEAREWLMGMRHPTHSPAV